MFVFCIAEQMSKQHADLAQQYSRSYHRWFCIGERLILQLSIIARVPGGGGGGGGPGLNDLDVPLY